jgi:hypothetical protein
MNAQGKQVVVQRDAIMVSDENISVLKTFPIKDKANLRYSVDFFNAFNRKLFGDPAQISTTHQATGLSAEPVQGGSSKCPLSCDGDGWEGVTKFRPWRDAVCESVRGKDQPTS